ncbi:MAG: hypothetical protein K0M70_03850 [Arenimonas sp.]|uniref:hypothetical protein n=1 Tax=Arenimonas sp. TaxID=1872635 RepID=UPI0025B836B8|nr:hypothetical protein [Arenimonas sp.]MBW8366975.1 hypothetical protein [Arenimonas sp.]
MTLRRLLPLAIALSLCACSQPEAPATETANDPSASAPALPSGEAAPAPEAAARPSATAGSIDFTVKGETKGSNSAGAANSVQCQLHFKATNRSQAPLKSVVAEFRVTTTVDGSLVDDESTLVMPFEIPPGETRDAWGPIVIDNHRCEDLDLTLQAPGRGACRTTDKTPCPSYALSGEGVAGAR